MSERKPIARGEKVWLRGYGEADLRPYLEFVQSRDAMWAGYSLPTSEDKIHDWYETVVRPQHGKEAYYFVVSPLGSEDFIGTCWVWNFASRLGGPEYSIFMHAPEKWGTGLGTDATNAAMDFVFGFTSTMRVWLASFSTNKRAHRSFEKSGFVHEGVVRGYALHRGSYVDAVQMSMLRSDWEKLDRPRSWDL